jgi:hypothetical protein
VAAAAAAKARKRAAAAEAATAAAEVEVVTKTPGRRRFGDSRLGPVALREFLMIGGRGGEGEKSEVEEGSGEEEENMMEVEEACRAKGFGPATERERQEAAEEARVHAKEAARAALRRLELAERRMAERWEAEEAEERAAAADEAAVEDPAKEEGRVEEGGARERERPAGAVEAEVVEEAQVEATAAGEEEKAVGAAGEAIEEGEATKWRRLVVRHRAAWVGEEDYVYAGRLCRGAPEGDACSWGNKVTKVRWRGGRARNNAGQKNVEEQQRAVREHRAWLLANPQEMARARAELRGKRLGCWCAPDPCHGHTLAEVANCSEEWLCRIVDEAFVERVAEEEEKVE